MGTKERRRDGLYDQLLEVAHREDDLDPNSSLAEIYARIHAKDVKHSWATQIEMVRGSRANIALLFLKGVEENHMDRIAGSMHAFTDVKHLWATQIEKVSNFKP